LETNETNLKEHALTSWWGLPSYPAGLTQPL
jgi:hypothetical protein